MGLVRNIPKGPYALTRQTVQQPESYYIPLYSLAKDELAIMLMSVGMAGLPFRMVLGAGASRSKESSSQKTNKCLIEGRVR
jgi:hypothetical protein